jgi:poly(3-hydroxybutyrate) depolymerase
MLRKLALLAVLTVACVDPAAAAESQLLPALGAAPAQTSVSGISSGAYMAGQYQFAHAKTVVGAAIIAGGPFGCAETRYGSYMPEPTHLLMNEAQSIAGCMRNDLAVYGLPDPAALADQARELANAGKIDPLADLAHHKVYLFSGLDDTIVVQPIVVAAAEVYLRAGVPAANIKTGPSIHAGHGFVAPSKSDDCPLSTAPFVVHCGYDQAGDLLGHIYGANGALEPKSAARQGELITFSQKPFTQDLPAAHLAESGAVYVPNACRAKAGCRIHIAFHGCQQTRADVGEAFIEGTGFEAWADTNHLIVLFPQASPAMMLNPLGCWDWWGYTGLGYLTRDAPQIAAVHRMVEQLSARP